MTDVILQPADGIDTFLYDDSATTNYGTNVTLFVGDTGGARYRTLIKFAGLSDGTIPPGAVISAATLSLYCYGKNSGATRNLRVYRTKRAWVETQATWNIYSTGNIWATAGGFGADDCEQTDIGLREFVAAETLNEYKNWTLAPSAVQEMYSGVFTDNGFFIKADTESNDRYSFYSSDNAANKPKLTITYSIAGNVQIIII